MALIIPIQYYNRYAYIEFTRVQKIIFVDCSVEKNNYPKQVYYFTSGKSKRNMSRVAVPNFYQ